MTQPDRSVPAVPFRHLFTYAEMESLMKRLAAARPGLARLSSLGSSREGREVYHLTLTDFSTGNPEEKPAYLIHGNIHAPELSGTHAALYTARQLLCDYPRKTALLRDVAFHIVPRLNPDGAEFAVRTGGAIRSRIDRDRLRPNTLVQKDLNGDGLILRMRREHPDGTMALDPLEPRLLVPRRVDLKPPFYHLYPEGEILEWDGSDAINIEGRVVDWNRQWSYDWRPEPEQAGAGDYPFSEPEMQAFARFIHAHPNLFGILGYHTGPAAFLRPPSSGTDADLPKEDLLRMLDFGRESHALTGLPTVPIIGYTNKRSSTTALHGHFPMTGYKHFGLFVFEYELGTIMNSAGIGFEQWKEVATIEEAQEVQRRIMRWWDRNGRKPPFFHPWKKFLHPQLGPVEIGGQTLRDACNMAMPDLRKRVEGTYRFTLHHAGQHPRVVVEDLDVARLAGGLYRIRARVANRGGLPTHVTRHGASLARLRTVHASLRPGKQVEVLSRRAHFDLGHLAAARGSADLEWFVRARPGARCVIRVDGGAGGLKEQTVTLG